MPRFQVNQRVVIRTCKDESTQRRADGSPVGHPYHGQRGVVVQVLPADHYDPRKIVVMLDGRRTPHYPGASGLLYFHPADVAPLTEE